jgi:hypothetical protein
MKWKAIITYLKVWGIFSLAAKPGHGTSTLIASVAAFPTWSAAAVSKVYTDDESIW